MNERRKYNYMENTLNRINSVISLPEADVKRNNIILKELLDKILEKMKENVLFKKMFQRVFYGGSFYDGLRVDSPSEFDLDLLMTLPAYAQPELTTSNSPGFVHLKLNNLPGFLKQPEAAAYYKNFETLFFDSRHYLDTKKVKAWMESVITKALNTFPSAGGSKKRLSTTHGEFEVYIQKSGPAMTLIAKSGSINMDIDLVPCFVFRAEKWPANGFIPNPIRTKPEFFIVPKEPKGLAGTDGTVGYRYWRLSFQEQERELMNGKKTLKPTIKLFKKLRCACKHDTLASYYIKTVVLHVALAESPEFWNNSLSYTFMYVFQKYLEYLDKKNIPYYWNKSNNLIRGANSERLIQIHSELKKIYNNIERNLNDPTVVERYILKDHNTNGLYNTVVDLLSSLRV